MTESFIGQTPDKPRFYGRRRGKRLRQTALGLLDTLLPEVEFTLPPRGEVEIINPAQAFSHSPQEIWLEIGFGGGEHVIAQAQAYPQHGIIGCEPFRNGVASIMGHLNNTGLKNVRVWPEDVRQLFPRFAEGSLSRVFLLFPDPWPKKRHADRRFVSTENLTSLARLLRDGGELRVASDDPIYQDWAEEHLKAHPDFEEILVTQDRDQVPQDWPKTRYEQKCLAENAPKFFIFRRKAR